MTDKPFPEFWYDWLLPFGDWQRAEWPKRNAFGKLVMVLQVPFVAVISMVSWAMMLFMIVSLAPILWLEKKVNAFSPMERFHAWWEKITHSSK